MRYLTALAVLTLMVAGCGKRVDVVATPNGAATVQRTGDQTTVNYQGKGGSATETIDKSGAVKVDYHGDKGDTVRMDTQSVIDPKELGVDLYPGATRLTGAGDSVRLDTEKGSVLTVRVSTSDKPAAVGDFYKKQLKDATSTLMGDTAIVAGKNSSGGEVTITADATKHKGTTEITVMVSKKKG